MPADTTQFLFIITALFFLFYGITAIRSKKMTDEFYRFGLNDWQRKLTGMLQIAGAIGLLAGFIYPILGFLASAGFTAMMLVAFIIRIKIRDSFAQASPSLFFMLINIWLTLSFYKLL